MFLILKIYCNFILSCVVCSDFSQVFKNLYSAFSFEHVLEMSNKSVIFRLED